MRLAAIALVMLGCAAAAPPPAKPVATPSPVPQPTEPTGLPAGYIEMQPAKVIPVDEGQAALMLVDEPSNTAVPIFIGGTEAASIQARLTGERPPRPLTHDLLDHMLAALSAHLVQVQVDDLRDDTFIGSVFVRANGRVIRFDARPSDAVALAIGAHVPIYVARKVIEQSAYKWDEIQKQLATPAAPSTSG
jgi:bifunctional DNase/RNase